MGPRGMPGLEKIEWRLHFAKAHKGVRHCRVVISRAAAPGRLMTISGTGGSGDRPIPGVHGRSPSANRNAILTFRALPMAAISESVTGRLPDSILEIAVRSMLTPKDCNLAARSSCVILRPDRYRASRILGPTTFLIAAPIVDLQARQNMPYAHLLC